METILDKYKSVSVDKVTTWFKAGEIKDFPSNRGGCVKYKDKQIAVFNFERRGRRKHECRG